MGWLAVGAALAGPVTDATARPDLAWKTLETPHFGVHYPVSRRDRDDPRWLSGEGTARRVGAVAERLWLPLSDTLGYFPRERIEIVVLEHVDELVGFTLPQWNLVVLSAHPGPQIHRMRGYSDWITGALAHELGHVWTQKAAGALAEPDSWGVEIGGVAEAGGRAVGVRIGIPPYEPYWWSEGAAEHLAERIGMSTWGVARERTLRVAVLDDRLLTWDALQTSADKAEQADGERAYQQGFAYARWLDARFGPGTFDAIGAAASRGYRWRWDGLIRNVTGEGAAALHATHTAELRDSVRAWVDAREAEGLAPGDALRDAAGPWVATAVDQAEGEAAEAQRGRKQRKEHENNWNLYPRISADGQRLVEHRSGWVRIASMDDGQTSDPEAAEVEPTPGEPTTWVPSAYGQAYDLRGDTLVVVASERLLGSGLLPDDGYDWDQLWRVDLTPDTNERTRPAVGVASLPRVLEGRALRRRATPIAGTLRATDPAISPDGRRLAFLQYADGTHNLVIAGIDGADPRALTAFADGTWMQGPRWSPDGSAIVVSWGRNGQQNLWRVEVATGAWTALTQGPVSATDPWWGEDGIYFVADPGGVSDVFRLDPDRGEVVRVTRVLGGAATPSITPRGDLLFASFTGSGWVTHRLARDAWRVEPTDLGTPDPREASRDLAFQPPVATGEGRPYRWARALLPPAISPIVRMDVTPAGPRPLGGAWVGWRDARESHELVMYGLVGEARHASAAWTWRPLRPEVQLYGDHQLDPRPIGATQARRSVDRAGATLRWPWNAHLAILGDVARAWIRVGAPELAGALASTRVTVGLELGDAAALARPLGSGGAFRLGWVRGWSNPETGVSYAFNQARSTFRMVAPPGRWRHHRFEVGWHVVVTDADLHPLEEVRAGGDHPYALRVAQVETSLPWPGYAPWSLSGEIAGIGTVGWRIPLARSIGRRWGPVTLDQLQARLAGDVGDVWTIEGEGYGAPILADAVVELRLGAFLAGSAWDSMIRLAWPWIPARPPHASDPASSEIDAGVGPRLYVGVGAGL